MTGPEPSATVPPVQTVIVLGAHRSGTSLIAGVLDALGVNMGPYASEPDWTARHWSNPTGHFEDPEFVRLNKRILRAGDALPGPETPSSGRPGVGEELRSRAKQLVQQPSGVWGWKDPHTVLTVNVYLRWLRNPYFIVCHRDRSQIVDSLRQRARRGDPEVIDGIDRYLRAIGRLEEVLRGFPVLDLEFPSLTARPNETVDRLVAFLRLRPTGAQLATALERFVSPRELEAASHEMVVREIVTWPRRILRDVARSIQRGQTPENNEVLEWGPWEMFRTLRKLVRGPPARSWRSPDASPIAGPGERAE